MRNIFKKLKNKSTLRILLGGFLTVLIIAGYLFYEMRNNRVFIELSQVNAPLISISPSTAGRLMEMDAHEGDLVKKGDAIAVVNSDVIRSTTDGLVAMASDQIGGSVSPQTPVAQLIDLSQMRIVGTIDENKGLDKLKVGQVASFTIDALPGKTFWGYVDEISLTAKQTQLSFSISSERPTQQFLVYVRFDSSEYPEIKNGMSAKMTVYTK